MIPSRFSLRSWPVMAVVVLCLALLVKPAPADDAGYASQLPVIIAPPGVFAVANEADLRAALEAANTTWQLPRIEVVADITLTQLLPTLAHPGGGTATIDGNGHTITGSGSGSVLTIGPGTAVVVEHLTITGGGEESGATLCGGGILTEGRLTLRDSRITGNQATDGGGLCVVNRTECASLTVENSQIDHNKAFSSGGGLYARAPGEVQCDGYEVVVSLVGSRVEANTAGWSGGGILAVSSVRSLRLAVTDSLVAENHAIEAWGGGIATLTTEGYVAATVNRSAVVNNTAPHGAGVYNRGREGIEWYEGGRADMTILNSTLSGNVSGDTGGAISNVTEGPSFPVVNAADRRTPRVPPPFGGGYMSVNYSTLSNNSAERGSGVWGSVYFFASIVAGNIGNGSDCGQDGWIQSGGYNLDGDGSCRLDQPTDLSGSRPSLLALTLNAPGKTPTHALGPDSQARDRIPFGTAGCQSATDTDQRGVRRPKPSGGRCDSGAFEAEK